MAALGRRIGRETSRAGILRIMVFNSFNLWAIVLSLMVLAAAGGTVFVWWKNRKARQASAAEVGNKEKAAGADILAVIDQSFADAKRQLKKSLSNIPIFLVVGPKGAGKTSILHNCGLDAELLAGQVSQGASIISTQALNIWLVRQAVFIEIAPSLASDMQALQRVLKHIS